MSGAGKEPRCTSEREGGRSWNKVSGLRNDPDKIHTDIPRALSAVLSEAEGLPDELQTVFDESRLDKRHAVRS